MNPNPKVLLGRRNETDFRRLLEGIESNRNENPEGGTKSIKPKNMNIA